MSSQRSWQHEDVYNFSYGIVKISLGYESTKYDLKKEWTDRPLKKSERTAP